jgi:glycosyltransferase involved in cell wall biosynthesis
MLFSAIIPAHKEERFIGGCLASIEAAAKPFPGEVEVIVVLNRCTDRTEEIARNLGAIIVRKDSKDLARIRNAGAQVAGGDIIVTIDADSRMTPNMLQEVYRRLSSGQHIGGGVLIKPERISLGIFMSLLTVVPVVLWQRMSAGLLWCYRGDFKAIGGFDESLVSVEDLDFAKRLKRHGRRKGKRFATITKAHIVTSCREFDLFGDWYLFKNPRLVWRIFTGKDQKAADSFFYDVDR